MAHPTTSIPALSLVAGLALSILPVGTAQAQTTRTFDNEDGDYDWYADANWNPDGVPEDKDAVIINTDQPVIVINPAGNNLVLGSIICMSGLTKSNGDLTVNGASEIVRFMHTSCCTDLIVANGSLRLEDASILTRVSFRGGGGITIAGDSIVDFSPLIQGTAQVTLTGNTLAPGGFRLADSGRLVISGQIPLPRAASISPSGPQVLQLTQLDGGELGFFDDVATNNRFAAISTDFTAQAGTIYADNGEFSVSSPLYRLSGTTLEARNQGTINVDGGSISGELENVTFQGSGFTRINNRTTFTGTSTNTMQDDLSLGMGLSLRGIAITFNGTLVNTGDIYARTNRFEGPGKLLVADGRYVQVFSTLNNATVEFAGGIADFRSTMTIGGETLISGGEVRINPGGSIVTQSGGVLTISGGTLVPGPDIGANQTVNVNAAIEMFGGEIRVNQGTFAMNANGSLFNNGTFNASPASESGTLRVFANTGQAFGVRDITAVGNGSLQLGANGSGNKGVINVLGTFTANLGNRFGSSLGTTIKTRLQGGGEFVNTGQLFIESATELAARTVNQGRIDTQSSNAKIFATLQNDLQVAQTRDIRVGDGGQILNNQSWTVSQSSNVLKDGNGGPITNRRSWSIVGTPGLQTVSQTIQPTFVNLGTVDVSGGTLTLLDCANIDENGVLSGGTWNTGRTSQIRFPNQTVTAIAGDSTRVRGDTNSMPDLASVTNIEDGAVVEIDEGREWFFPELENFSRALLRSRRNSKATTTQSLGLRDGSQTIIEPTGEVESAGDINVGAPDLPSAIDTIEGVISLAKRGPRTVEPSFITAQNLNLAGKLVPGGDGNAFGSIAAGVGAFDINANLNAFAPAEFLFDVDSPNNHDTIAVTGNVNLDGTLRVATPVGFDASSGQTIELISVSSGSITGSFADVIITGPGVEQLVLNISPTAVSLVFGCPPDVDSTGAVDIEDLLAVLRSFGSNAGGDTNGDGDTDIEDLLLVLRSFGNSCAEVMNN